MVVADRRVGIRDVAAEAGVSVTTVSHVLNNVAYARASDETRQRVRAAAAKLGYGPNRLARGLRTQRSEMIGVLSEQIATTPHAGRIILGAQDAARRHGLTLLIINTEPDQMDHDAEAVLRQQVDGVLLATMYHREIEVPERLAGVATVLIDATDSVGRLPSVVPDERAGAVAAVRELTRYGHRHIGFLTNVDNVPATTERLVGYRATLAEAGIKFEKSLVVARVSETWGGYEAARVLLGRRDRPTALFCYNDRMAMGAYRAAAELGIRIPDDLSIVGFDNQAIIAEGLYPALTTVALPHYEMGEWALEALVRVLQAPGKPAGVEETTGLAAPVLLECPLIVRKSVTQPHL
jgi:LacI family transcriptional regulator